jgi:hypothetical protein
MREQLVQLIHQMPFCRLVIRLASGTGIGADAPDQLGQFSDQAVQYTDVQGRWQWIPYGAIVAVEFKDQPPLPPEAYR